MKNEEKLTYEQAFSRLEEISEAMGSASVPLEKLIEMYEEGMGLASYCEKLLKSYEARLEKISKQALINEAQTDDVPSEDTDEEAPF